MEIYAIYKLFFYTEVNLKLEKSLKKSITLIVLTFFLTNCFYISSPFRKAKKALEKKDCLKALSYFSKIYTETKKLKLAKKAGPLCAIEHPLQAKAFYEYLSVIEQDTIKRLSFKQTLADIYFKLKNYEKSIEVYSFLKKQKNIVESKKERFSFQIALAYFELKKWPACLKELEKLINPQSKGGVTSSLVEQSLKADILFLKARAFLMWKKYSLAETTFLALKKAHPIYFKTQDGFLYLAFIYESQKEFSKALSYLKSSDRPKAFLDKKIEQLKKRQKNQPGQGF